VENFGGSFFECVLLAELVAAKVSEEVNRKCRRRNTITFKFQPPIEYTDLSATMHSATDARQIRLCVSS